MSSKIAHGVGAGGVVSLFGKTEARRSLLLNTKFYRRAPLFAAIGVNGVKYLDLQSLSRPGRSVARPETLLLFVCFCLPFRFWQASPPPDMESMSQGDGAQRAENPKSPSPVPAADGARFNKTKMCWEVCQSGVMDPQPTLPFDPLPVFVLSRKIGCVRTCLVWCLRLCLIHGVVFLSLPWHLAGVIAPRRVTPHHTPLLTFSLRRVRCTERCIVLPPRSRS